MHNMHVYDTCYTISYCQGKQNPHVLPFLGRIVLVELSNLLAPYHVVVIATPHGGLATGEHPTCEFVVHCAREPILMYRDQVHPSPHPGDVVDPNEKTHAHQKPSVYARSHSKTRDEAWHDNSHEKHERLRRHKAHEQVHHEEDKPPWSIVETNDKIANTAACQRNNGQRWEVHDGVRKVEGEGSVCSIGTLLDKDSLLFEKSW
mmetsp:Transcript_41229/g.78765  ORF Transcript_41229/g.78765 Transcript_41229/m.78765 type:complete len:204 (-) Transcript_41229:579-1190(-)